MLPRTKGKALEDISTSKLDRKVKYLSSVKYDGNYIQIDKRGEIVRFFTSGGKEFHWEDVADTIRNNFNHINFTIEGEYIEKTSGLLGDRPKAAKLTTYRTNYTKKIRSNLTNERVKIFDIIYLSAPTTMKDHSVDSLNAVDRYAILSKMFNNGIKVPGLEVVKADILTLDEAILKAKKLVKDGWEGLYVKAVTSRLHPGKRLNECIKIKFRKTADLLCIGTEDGEGKYTGMIGSLILQDSKGRVVSVGSGLDDMDRAKRPSWFLNKVIQIEYEQIIDTYIQPTYNHIREDKNPGDID